jgi:murein DD-endopeptidase MepM/ murein hydrolase activator NlpD
MILFDLGLPARYRLSVSFTKRRENLDNEPFVPNLGKVLRSKNPNKVSVFFRHIFENEKVKKIFGANLAFLVIASSLIPPQNTFKESEENTEIQTPLVLSTQNGVRYPLGKIKITTPFRFYHPGIDLDGETGDVIKPIMGGKVEFVGYSKYGYGNSVVINHGSGTSSLYAHLSKIDVKEGDVVNNETKLGEVGASGRAFGDHLHLEVHENGRAINPLSILPSK